MITPQIEKRRKWNWLRRCSSILRVGLALAIVGGSAYLIAPSEDADAAAGDRALKLYNIHTDMTTTVVFKHNGQYVQSGLDQLNYFLRDWRQNRIIKMDPHLFDLIWQVYQDSGSHDFIHVVCGYRSPPTNEMLRGRSRSSGVAQHSQHMLGKAMDFFIPDVPLAKLRVIGMRMQIGGVGFYPTSGSPFVHMDTGNVRHWPRMTHDQLARVFPNGHTLHIPSDGRPLPGYEEALAAYKARKAAGGTIMMASSDTPKKSFFGKLFGGGNDESAAEDGIPDTAAADAQARAADGDTAPAAPQPAAKPAVIVADAAMPLPRPAPVRAADQIALADAASPAGDVPMPPMPRPSPVARPMVAMANAAADGNAVYSAAGKAQLAAAAIAEQIGGKHADTSADAVLAYASPAAGEDPAAPHIDADSGALVGGRGVTASAAGWTDPMAHLSPVSYSADTIALITRSGSTRQIGYAEFRKPNPFATPALFSVPQNTVALGFGRIAYEGLRTDRFAGPFVQQLQTQHFAAANTPTYRQTASLYP